MNIWQHARGYDKWERGGVSQSTAGWELWRPPPPPPPKPLSGDDRLDIWPGTELTVAPRGHKLSSFQVQIIDGLFFILLFAQVSNKENNFKKK